MVETIGTVVEKFINNNYHGENHKFNIFFLKPPNYAEVRLQLQMINESEILLNDLLFGYRKIMIYLRKHFCNSIFPCSP